MPMSDEELMHFCTANETLRVEREANGEIRVMSPVGSESSGRNMEISADLAIWTRHDRRGKAFDSSGGFTLPDGSMLSPDAAWIDFSRWNKLSQDDQRRFAQSVRTS
jgi:Uma2 family endonuclease